MGGEGEDDVGVLFALEAPLLLGGWLYLMNRLVELDVGVE